jgi:hypothetical protein
METYRRETAAERGFAPLRRRYGEVLLADSRLADLSDTVLLALAAPGEESASALYEMIMGVLALGPLAKFAYMDKADQMRVVDIHLFLADQIRFEMMRRLRWVTAFACGEHPLVSLVLDFNILKSCRERPPELADDHPSRLHYEGLGAGDKEAFVRRLLPAALQAFGDGGAPDSG